MFKNETYKDYNAAILYHTLMRLNLKNEVIVPYFEEKMIENISN
jgi:hypothetical protein